MHLLVGLLTSSDARYRLLAVCCLHQLSHSPNTSVLSACLPATPYLITYLSGQSTRFTVGPPPSQMFRMINSILLYYTTIMETIANFKFVHVCISAQELCLYTLGNICQESQVVKERLLAQGIIPALASCLQVRQDPVRFGFILFFNLITENLHLKTVFCAELSLTNVNIFF